eukprot:5847631-Prymnesium_polylepis.1
MRSLWFDAFEDAHRLGSGSAWGWGEGEVGVRVGVEDSDSGEGWRHLEDAHRLAALVHRVRHGAARPQVDQAQVAVDGVVDAQRRDKGARVELAGEAVAAQVDGLDRRVGAEEGGDGLGALVEDVVRHEVELLELGVALQPAADELGPLALEAARAQVERREALVDVKRLGEHPRHVGRDGIVVEVQLGQVGVGLERERHASD